MCHDILILGQVHPELLRERDQPSLRFTIASRHRVEVLITALITLFSSIYPVNTHLVVHVNTVKTILLDPRCHTIRRGDRVSI